MIFSKMLLLLLYLLVARQCVPPEGWLETVEGLMKACPSAGSWLLEYLRKDEGAVHLKIFVECPSSDMRLLFTKMLSCAMLYYPDHHKEDNPMTLIIKEVLSFLDKEVVESYRYSGQYFDFLSEYASLVSLYVNQGPVACDYIQVRTYVIYTF